MTGQELYEIYRQEHEARGVGVDNWEDLYEGEREVWNAIGLRVIAV